MGNKLSSNGAEYVDDEASLSLGEDFSDSSLELNDSRSVAAVSSTDAAADPAVNDTTSGGRQNLAFAPSLKDVSARAVAISAPQPQPDSGTPDPISKSPASPSPAAGTRICPILQNGRQVTKDFYWVLPERQARRNQLSGGIVEYENFGEVRPPAPPPRRVCRSESSGGVAGAGVGSGSSGSGTFRRAKKLCRRATSSALSPGSAIASSAASALLPHQWQQSQVRQVQDSVPGVTEDECCLALGLNSGDTRLAVQFLKVEQLFRLGLAERTACLAELRACSWCLETAGNSLTDKMTS
ncbi:hypothetical protein BOX15_Mlig027856g1 [Macrostomum lignano]|uniref:UBA domain-containing protein n=1 Tax=Macrostomum lignano TaxID=282301 RepID=A0A267GQX9_9PLAT|nr:hypothetical protein BOX15_Mlig027856g1 [Macrostomum lignano]